MINSLLYNLELTYMNLFSVFFKFYKIKEYFEKLGYNGKWRKIKVKREILQLRSVLQNKGKEIVDYIIYEHVLLIEDEGSK